MDWAFAIERNREPLLRIVATLFAMIGLTETGAVERLSRPLYRAVLGVLRPAESAVRRLIIVAARGMVVKPSPPRPAPAGLVISGKGQGRVSFQLFDPRQRFDERLWPPAAEALDLEPRIRFIDVAFDPRIPLFRQTQPAAAAPAPRDRMTPSMRGLCAAVSPPSSARWKTCRARPGASRAGGPGRSRRAVRGSKRRCASVRRRVTASGKPMRSMRS